MNGFGNLREEFSKELEKITINLEKSCWDFYTNSTPENMEVFEKYQDAYSKCFQNREYYEKFLAVDKNKLSKREKKQLHDILKEFDNELNTGEELQALRKKENEIAQKFNSYIPKIDNKEVSKVEITRILETEINPEIRKKAYNAKIKGGDLIADDLVAFVKMRNEYAQNKGFTNYFEYMLQREYDVDSEFLNKLIDESYSSAGGRIANILNKKQTELKEFFKTDNLKNYHYGLLLDSNPEKEVNEILEKNDIVKISKNMYQNMGYNIPELEEKGFLTLDLFPRKGKNTHGFCFCIEAGKDARILANLINNVSSLDTLNHELGHCVYDLGLGKNLVFFDRQPASSAMTEAIAMMMGDVIKTEPVLQDILPTELLTRFMDSHKDDEASFVARSLLIIEFEREMYNNPEQNLSELWKKLTQKYFNRELDANNEWATIPHYLSHPGYYQNYFRANLMKVQMYNHLKLILGDITASKDSAKYMDENIFALGASLNEYDLIKKLTGEDFSAKAFIKSIV